MKDRIKLALKFDVELLQSDLRRLEGGIEWIDHFVKNNYEGEWTVIPLRGPAGAQHPVMMIYSDPTCTEFEDTHFLQSCPYIQEVLRLFDCPLQAVRLMKLTPGSVTNHFSRFEGYECAMRGRIEGKLHCGIAYECNHPNFCP